MKQKIAAEETAYSTVLQEIQNVTKTLKVLKTQD